MYTCTHTPASVNNRLFCWMYVVSHFTFGWRVTLFVGAGGDGDKLPWGPSF